MQRPLIPALAAAAALTLGACGGSAGTLGDGDDAAGTPPAAGMCAEGVTDCVDTVVNPDGEVPPEDPWDTFDSESARDRARAQLGLAEDELDPEVRVSRRGEEELFLTEDYRLGRLTVQLDDDGTGTFRVTSVVVELPDGPETFTAE